MNTDKYAAEYAADIERLEAILNDINISDEDKDSARIEYALKFKDAVDKPHLANHANKIINLFLNTVATDDQLHGELDNFNNLDDETNQNKFENRRKFAKKLLNKIANTAGHNFVNINIKPNRNGDICGQYRNNTIYIAPDECADVNSFMATLMHEYNHYLDFNNLGVLTPTQVKMAELTYTASDDNAYYVNLAEQASAAIDAALTVQSFCGRLAGHTPDNEAAHKTSRTENYKNASKKVKQKFNRRAMNNKNKGRY